MQTEASGRFEKKLIEAMENHTLTDTDKTLIVPLFKLDVLFAHIEAMENCTHR